MLIGRESGSKRKDWPARSNGRLRSRKSMKSCLTMKVGSTEREARMREV